MLAQLARKWKQLALFAVALAVCAVLAELVFRSFVRGSRAAAADGFTHGLL